MRRMILAALLTLSCLPALAAPAVEPFVGRWALDLPGNSAGWLEVKPEDGWLDGSVLWGGGSVLPLDSVYLNGVKILDNAPSPDAPAARSGPTSSVPVPSASRATTPASSTATSSCAPS